MKKIKAIFNTIRDIYRVHRFCKIMIDESKYILSLPEDEALIQITRWNWDMAKIEMDEIEEEAWKKFFAKLRKKVLGENIT